jgi:TetR/AcrR family transcriptional regulator, transcriptional repressor for nem operon
MPKKKKTGSDSGQRLGAAAGRGFRLGGFGGIGVDAIAQDAGLTSGAFYAHFGSKAEAFRFAIEDGLSFLRRGIELFQSKNGKDWLGPFVDFYLGERMNVDLSQACALPTFMADAARADAKSKMAYQFGLEQVATAIAEGLSGENRQARAWALLALLSGAAGMARAVTKSELKAEILGAAKKTALSV